MMAKRYQ